MKKVIGCRGKKSDLIGILSTPEDIEPVYEKWEQSDIL